MSETISINSSDIGVVRVRAFVEFADALSGDEVLDRDQVSQLIREVAAIDAFSTLQARRYGTAAADNARMRGVVITEQSVAHTECQRIRVEYSGQQAALAAMEKQIELDRDELADAERDLQKEEEAAAEAANNLSSLQWWAGAISDPLGSAVNLSGKLDRLRQVVPDLQSRVRQSARILEESRAECRSAEARLGEVRDRLARADATLVRIEAAILRASEGLAIANIAEYFCIEMSFFMKARAGDEIDAYEFVTRLDSPIEGVSTDGSEPLTGRMALERLVTLAATTQA